MILRILAASFVALGLGLIVEEGHAAETVLCRDGRIVEVAGSPDRRADPCRRVASSAPAAPVAVPLPVKRPARPARAAAVELKGATEAAPSRRLDEPFRQAATDYRRVRIINARPGAAPWYNHTR